MQFNLLNKQLEKISLELSDTINLLFYEKQTLSTFALKYLENLEHILHTGKNVLDTLQKMNR